MGSADGSFGKEEASLMQLSRDEYLRVSQLRPSGGVRVSSIGVIATAPAHREVSAEYSPANPVDIQSATDSVERVPDVREEVVASLRARIESGNYHVTGDQIADMLLRRLLADRVR
jgi:anti-sigma28 factor (negative regulator of flagellin synthesis)